MLDRKLESRAHQLSVRFFSFLFFFFKNGSYQREASPSISHASFPLLFSLSVSDVRQAHAREAVVKKDEVLLSHHDQLC